MKFIDRVTTEHTGGNCYVDLVHLKDGRVLGVTDECVVLYPNIHAFENNDGYDPGWLASVELNDMIDLISFPPASDYDNPGEA